MNYYTLAAYVLFAPLIGGLLTGIDRIITARMQGRQGPPLLQPFYDVLKLFMKQNIVVNLVQSFFMIGFLAFAVFTGALFFGGGDLLLVIFALTLSSIFLIMGAFSSNSPYSSIGADREMMQIMSYEPMLLATAVGIYMVTGTFSVSDLLQYNGFSDNAIMNAGTMPVVYLPGVFIGFLFILTIKLRKSPFDISTSHHAHQEVVKGLTTEFSGRILGLMEIAHWYETVLYLGIVALFILNGRTSGWITALVVCLATFFLEILIDNINARVKWQFLLKITWVVTLIAGFLNLLVLSIIKMGGN